MPLARKQNRRPKTSTYKNTRRRGGRPHTAGGKKPNMIAIRTIKTIILCICLSLKDIIQSLKKKSFLMQECASEWLDKGQKRLNSKIELLQKLIQEKEEKELLKRPM